MDNTRITPSEWKGDIRKKVKFHCESEGNTLWFFLKLSTDPISYKNELLIDDVSSIYDGNYYCYGSYHVNGSHFVARSTLTTYGM